MSTRFLNIQLKRRRAPTLRFIVLLLLSAGGVNFYVDAGDSPLLYIGLLVFCAFICWVVSTSDPIQSSRNFRFRHLRHTRMSSNFNDSKIKDIDLEKLSNLEKFFTEENDE